MSHTQLNFVARAKGDECYVFMYDNESESAVTPRRPTRDSHVCTNRDCDRLAIPGEQGCCSRDCRELARL